MTKLDVTLMNKRNGQSGLFNVKRKQLNSINIYLDTFKNNLYESIYTLSVQDSCILVHQFHVLNNRHVNSYEVLKSTII